MKSSIYSGWVEHKRFAVRSHNLKYNISMLYLDLSELPEIFRPYLFWSYNKANLACFFDSDYGMSAATNLESHIRNYIEKKLNIIIEGPIRLLTNLRYFGYGFNPVSFYYIFDKTDTYLEMIIAEVCNTPWGEKHLYVLHDINQQSKKKYYHYIFDKAMHVSPFLSMDYQYRIYLSLPNDKLHIHMQNYQNNNRHFTATLSLKRQPINSRNLNKLLFTFPPMTIKIIIAIYWNALKIYLKRIPFISHPGKKNEKI